MTIEEIALKVRSNGNDNKNMLKTMEEASEFIQVCSKYLFAKENGVDEKKLELLLTEVDKERCDLENTLVTLGDYFVLTDLEAMGYRIKNMSKHLKGD